jgi:DNA-binding MarR family transcriptional regulator
MSASIAVRAIVALYREFEQVARADEMTMPQYRMLLFLAKGRRRAGELAALSEVKRPSVTPIIQAMTERGWITRAADDLDRRSARLSITPEGSAALEGFEAKLIASFLAYVPEAVRDETLASLESVSAALKAARGERFAEMEAELLDARVMEAHDS